MTDADRERDAARLGRHYVAGDLDAEDFSARMDRLYGEDPATALAGLPAAEPPPPAPVRSRKGWWRPRHGESDGPRPDWIPTPERFVDPTTSRVMRVWLEPGARTRHYVAEREP